MTQEGQGPRPDETRQPLTPPTSTRWSEEPVEDSPDLAPPFVPGRTGRDAERVRGPAAESLSEETAEAVTAPTSSEPETAAPDEPAPFPFETGPDAGEETGMPVSAEDEDFPFDQFDIEGDEEAAPAWDSGEAGEPEIEGSDLSGAWITEAPEAGESDAGRSEVEAPDSEPLEDEPEPWGELPEEPAPWAETVAEAVDEAPTAGPTDGAEPAEGGEATEGGEAAEGGEAVEPPPAGADEEMAALLERLARTIREEGEAGVRREIDSPDRLTSLIAGLLAGHLSARS